jgi:hypothetical protein
VRNAVATLITLAAMSVGAARAQPGESAEAYRFFKAGAAAFARADYLAAIDAFREAHRLSGRPGPVFSIAQSYNRQYRIDRRPEHLRAAIESYHKYLDLVREGGRRAEATEALAELERAAEAPAPAAAVDAPAPAPQGERPTTGVVLSSPTPGARLWIDAQPVDELPYIGAIAPGRHHLRLSARGFHDHERVFVAPEGKTFSLDYELEPLPARLVVQAPDGANVALDGRTVGEAPIAAALSVPAGSHTLAVTATGYRPFVQELALLRGEERAVAAELDTTTQRIAAWIVLGAAAGGVAAAAVLGGLALGAEGDAEQILAESETGNIDYGDVDDYEAARDRRATFTTASLVTAGASALVAGVGVLLFALDDPEVTLPVLRAPASNGRIDLRVRF